MTPTPVISPRKQPIYAIPFGARGLFVNMAAANGGGNWAVASSLTNQYNNRGKKIGSCWRLKNSVANPSANKSISDVRPRLCLIGASKPDSGGQEAVARMILRASTFSCKPRRCENGTMSHPVFRLSSVRAFYGLWRFFLSLLETQHIVSRRLGPPGHPSHHHIA
ncbi:hypothetical protein ACRALDRAFT_213488 [Sodiomyces alcalophilus JCM 7366]|uniref:uncharacterized protein n=1 Tax=Sodiomyces alcalophilus JCM 7366 TaxID=591952 RepID=UPI0039B43422